MDTVDPYTYPLVYGRTPQLTSDQMLKEVLVPKAWYYAFSTRFSYLPTAFHIAASTEPCRATAQGYINGVPPHMPSMSANISEIVSRTIPLFEHVLADVHSDNSLRQRVPGTYRFEQSGQPEEPVNQEDDEAWSKYQLELDDWYQNRPLVLPDIADGGELGGQEKKRIRVSLRGKDVNIVVRMTEVRLVSILFDGSTVAVY